MNECENRVRDNDQGHVLIIVIVFSESCGVLVPVQQSGGR